LRSSPSRDPLRPWSGGGGGNSWPPQNGLQMRPTHPQQNAGGAFTHAGPAKWPFLRIRRRHPPVPLLGRGPCLGSRSQSCAPQILLVSIISNTASSMTAPLSITWNRRRSILFSSLSRSPFFFLLFRLRAGQPGDIFVWIGIVNPLYICCNQGRPSTCAVGFRFERNPESPGL